MTKAELIRILEPAVTRRSGKTVAESIALLEASSLAELQQMLERQLRAGLIQRPEPLPPPQQLEDANADDLAKAQQELADVQEENMRRVGEIRAEQLLHQLRMHEATEPRRKAEAVKQEKQDRRTFADAAKTIRSFAPIEANFNLIRQTLGDGFSVHQIQQMLAVNGAILSPPTQHELNEWRREAAQAHQDYLKNASSEELRAAARAESTQVKKTAAQQQFEFELLKGYERDVIQNGSSPLPKTWNGQVLDASFIKRCDKQTLAVMMRKHGSAQISARLHGIKRVGNYSFEGE